MKPARFRSKPFEVEAVQVTPENFHEVAEWCKGGFTRISGYMTIHVPTINGVADAKLGHWIVKGPNDFYPCDPDSFAARWEPT